MMPTVTIEELDQAAESSVELPNLSRNRQIMLRFLEDQTPEEIGEALGLSEAVVGVVLRSPLVREEIERVWGESNPRIKERLKRIGDEAVSTLRDTMRGRLGSELRFKAAKELLDKHPELEKKASDENAMAGLGEAIIRELARRARASLETVSPVPLVALNSAVNE